MVPIFDLVQQRKRGHCVRRLALLLPNAPSFPKAFVSSFTFSTRRIIKTTWDPYPPWNTDCRAKTCPSIEPKNSKGGVENKIPSTTAIPKTNSDVPLITDACQCQKFEEISGSNPLERCITIASACNLFYRAKHMPERHLASEPV